MRFLAVKNWEKFQHYKDRSPPWIKFYAETLDDLAFTMLPEAAQAQLMKLWLFASKCSNCIPWDRRIISQAIKAGPRLYLKEIMAAGFIYELQHPASNGASAPLAESEQDAMPSRAGTRAREEGEGRGQRAETETPPATGGAGARRGREQLLAALSESRRTALTSSFGMWLSGHDLMAGMRTPTLDEIDRTCLDVMATCELGNLSPKVFLKFLAKTLEPEEAPALNGKRGHRTHSNVDGWDEVYGR